MHFFIEAYKLGKYFFKKTWFYFFIIICCVASYFLTKSFISKKQVEKKIGYTSNTAFEIFMVWGIMDGSLPVKNAWPAGSYEKNGMIWTKMKGIGNEFHTMLTLPAGSHIYYWMVQTRDKSNQASDVWYSGRDDNQYFTGTFYYGGLINPGFFIFLAGLILLLLFYFRNKHKPQIVRADIFRIKDYFPQLDSIRAIAVLLVIIHHWAENSILNFLPNGRIGVNTFFVLSGFLITRILLKAKKQAEDQGLKKGTIFRNFYIRRTLRIFPIYYLFLIILWFLQDPAIIEDGVYYFTYTLNYLFYSREFFPTRVAHLWSLGVEEQFYLLWPWLVVLTNKKILPYLIALFLVIGISSNYIFTDKGWWVEIFTPSCFDAFATGGFLSWLVAYRQDLILKLQPIYKFIFIAALLLFVSDVFNISIFPTRTVHSFFALGIIYYCLFKNNNRFVNLVLNNKWLIRIGKISYGIYLYHLFIPELWNWVIKKFANWNIDLLYNNKMPVNFKPAWLFIQHFAVLMIICIVSWKLIEKPINGLKKLFENKAPKKSMA